MSLRIALNDGYRNPLSLVPVVNFTSLTNLGSARWLTASPADRGRAGGAAPVRIAEPIRSPGKQEPANRCTLVGMILDLDIYRAAKLLIDQHGAEVALNAAGRADLLLEEGDAKGCRDLAGDSPVLG